MSETKLLPCPFCGGEAEVCGYYFIQCTKCGSSTLTHTNREESIKAWNTRKPMERIVERFEKESDYWLDKYDEKWKKGFINSYADGCMDAFDRAIEIVKEVINK